MLYFTCPLLRDSEVGVCVCVGGGINHLHCRSDTLTSQKRKHTETITFIACECLTCRWMWEKLCRRCVEFTWIWKCSRSAGWTQCHTGRFPEETLSGPLWAVSSHWLWPYKWTKQWTRTKYFNIVAFTLSIKFPSSACLSMQNLVHDSRMFCVITLRVMGNVPPRNGQPRTSSVANTQNK